MDKNFTDDHPYYKVFNRKTLNVSYSCMPNMKQLMMAHNRKMLNTQDKERRMCDCRKQDCPVNGRCLMENVNYRASVTTANGTKFYVGSTGLTFKKDTLNTNTASGMKNIVIRQLCHNTFGN